MVQRSVQRLAALWRSSVNEFCERLEDPRQMARQAVRDLEAAVEDAVSALARAVAHQRLVERRIQQGGVATRSWEERSEQAVAAGDGPAARLAVRRRVQLEAEQAQMEAALAESRADVARWRQQLETAQAQLRAAQWRPDRVPADAARSGLDGEDGPDAAPSAPAEACVRLERTMAEQAAVQARCEERVEAAAVEADLYHELAADRRADRAAATAELTQRVEAELAALRARVRPQG